MRASALGAAGDEDREGIAAAFDGGRIAALCGDVAAPGLGLDAPAAAQLRATVATVVHCAAVVNHVLPYSAHRDANVVGTARLLRMASGLHAKEASFHYVSTTAAAASGASGSDSRGGGRKKSGSSDGGDDNNGEWRQCDRGGNRLSKNATTAKTTMMAPATWRRRLSSFFLRSRDPNFDKPTFINCE